MTVRADRSRQPRHGSRCTAAACSSTSSASIWRRLILTRRRRRWTFRCSSGSSATAGTRGRWRTTERRRRDLLGGSGWRGPGCSPSKAHGIPPARGTPRTTRHSRPAHGRRFRCGCGPGSALAQVSPTPAPAGTRARRRRWLCRVWIVRSRISRRCVGCRRCATSRSIG